MAYCLIADVSGLLAQRTFSATTKPTITQVNTFISDIAAEIDTALLSRGLTAPATTPTDFVTHLKQVNAMGAAALAEQAMFPEAGGMGSTPNSKRLWEMYQAALKALKADPLPSSMDSALPGGYATECAEGDNDPVFTKDMEF
jgi:hypothetical protein